MVTTLTISTTVVECKAECEARGTDCIFYQVAGVECMLFNIINIQPISGSG